MAVLNSANLSLVDEWVKVVFVQIKALCSFLFFAASIVEVFLHFFSIVLLGHHRCVLIEVRLSSNLLSIVCVDAVLFVAVLKRAE